MALPEVRDRQEGFAGGLNTTSDDAALQNNECRVLTNAQLSRRGAAKKRLGTQRAMVNPLAAGIIGGFSWGRTASTQEVLIAGGKLYTGALGIPMTLTDRGGTFSTTVLPTFAAFKGPSAEGVYIADGGLLNFWDGTTLTENIVNTPAVESIVSWGPRLFGFKDDTLYWSDTGSGINGHTLGAAAGGGQAIVRTYGGQALVTGAPLKNSLILLHRNAVSRFTGSTIDDISISAGTTGISGDVGTVSKRGVIALENAVYFLSDRGVFAVSETDVQPVSSPLEGTLANLTKTQWANVTVAHARAHNEIRWSIPSVGVYVYNYRTQGWSGPWTGAYLTSAVTAMWDTVDVDGRPVVLTGHANGHLLWNDRAGLYVDNAPAELAYTSTEGFFSARYFPPRFFPRRFFGTTSESLVDSSEQYTFQVQCKRFFAGDYTADKSWRTLYALGDFPDPAGVTYTVQSSGTAVTQAIPYSRPAQALTLQWGEPSTQWGASGTVWGGVSNTSVEDARMALHGTNPWCDVTFTYTGTQGARLSIVDAVGYARRRR